ncbi:MAG: hypothetical protein OXF84_14620 [Bacteroidetes bacterium]|nr:hypothetical protein [Bacteroidota bacterium]
MAFPRIAELLDTKDRTPKETNELTELIFQQASSDAITRIDALKEILLIEIRAVNDRFDGTNDRFDGTNDRFDGVNERFEMTNERIEMTNERIDALKEILLTEIRATNERIDGTNRRVDAIQKTHRWIIGLLVAIGTGGLGALGILVRIWLSIPV